MNTLRKIVSQVSSYFSILGTNPYTARFDNNIGDRYMGVVGGMSLDKNALKEKKWPIPGVITFEWITRVNIWRGLHGEGFRYVPIDIRDGKVIIPRHYRIRLSLIESKFTVIGGTRKLELGSIHGGMEKFLISNDKSDFDLVKKILDYES